MPYIFNDKYYKIIHKIGLNNLSQQSNSSLIIPNSFLNNLFYATTEETSLVGSNFRGTIYRADADGNVFDVLYLFSGLTQPLTLFKDGDGDRPIGSLIEAPNGLLYGTTDGGGVWTNSSQTPIYGNGILFSYDPLGNTYNILYRFSGITNFDPIPSLTDGGRPQANLKVISGTTIFGTTCAGGYNPIGGGTELGSIWKFDTSTNTYSILHHITASTEGRKVTELILANDDNLYFTTKFDGAGFPWPAGGSLVKLDLNGNSTVIHQFTNTPDGADPSASLLQASNNLIYGTTTQGGTGGYGTIYTCDTSGNYGIIYNFLGGINGQNPSGSLYEYSPGLFYGMAYGGGNFNLGVIYSSDTFGNVGVIHHFGSFYLDGESNYRQITNLSTGVNGSLFGVTNGGGIGSGTIYTWIDTCSFIYSRSGTTLNYFDPNHIEYSYYFETISPSNIRVAFACRNNNLFWRKITTSFNVIDEFTLGNFLDEAPVINRNIFLPPAAFKGMAYAGPNQLFVNNRTSQRVELYDITNTSATLITPVFSLPITHQFSIGNYTDSLYVNNTQTVFYINFNNTFTSFDSSGQILNDGAPPLGNVVSMYVHNGDIYTTTDNNLIYLTEPSAPSGWTFTLIGNTPYNEPMYAIAQDNISECLLSIPTVDYSCVTLFVRYADDFYIYELDPNNPDILNYRFKPFYATTQLATNGIYLWAHRSTVPSSFIDVYDLAASYATLNGVLVPSMQITVPINTRLGGIFYISPNQLYVVNETLNTVELWDISTPPTPIITTVFNIPAPYSPVILNSSYNSLYVDLNNNIFYLTTFTDFVSFSVTPGNPNPTVLNTSSSTILPNGHQIINMYLDNGQIYVTTQQGYIYLAQPAVGGGWTFIQQTFIPRPTRFGVTQTYAEDCVGTVPPTPLTGCVITGLTVTGCSDFVIVSGDSQDITCLHDGSVSIQISGGCPNYTYTLYHPNISTQVNQVVTPNKNWTFTGLTDPGNYYVSISGCSGATLVTLSPFTILDNNTFYNNIFQLNNEEFCVTVSGGTLPYIITIDGVSQTYQSADTYCFSASCLTPPSPSLIRCRLSNNNGRINRAWDGTPLSPCQHTFTILDLTVNGVQYGPGTPLTVTAPSGLMAGIGTDGNSYVTNITDWINSYVPAGFTFWDDMKVVDRPVGSTFNLTISYFNACAGTTQQYTYNDSTGWTIPGPQTYSTYDCVPLTIGGGSQTGRTVTISDAEGCSASTVINYTCETPTISISGTNLCCNNDGSVSITVNNGVPAFSVTGTNATTGEEIIVTSPTTPINIDHLTPGNWTFVVQDSYGNLITTNNTINLIRSYNVDFFSASTSPTGTTFCFSGESCLDYLNVIIEATGQITSINLNPTPDAWFGTDGIIDTNTLYCFDIPIEYCGNDVINILFFNGLNTNINVLSGSFTNPTCQALFGYVGAQEGTWVNGYPAYWFTLNNGIDVVVYFDLTLNLWVWKNRNSGTICSSSPDLINWTSINTSPNCQCVDSFTSSIVIAVDSCGYIYESISLPCPTLTLSGTSVNPTCIQNCSGTITLTSSGGQSPFTFQLTDSNGNTLLNSIGQPTIATNITTNSYTFTNLCSGTYYTLITDSAFPIPATANTTPIVLINTFIASANVLPITINGTGGTICFTVTGGSGNYNIDIQDTNYTYPPVNDTIVDGETCFDLPFGCYDWSIIDPSTLCQYTGNTCIPETPFGCGDYTYTDPTCTNDGTLTINVSGGTGPYQFDLYLNGIFNQTGTNSVETFTFQNLVAGTYNVLVTDLGSGTVLDCVTVTLVNTFSVQFISGSTCENPGYYCVSFSGGNPPYIIEFDQTIQYVEYIAGTYCYQAPCGTYELTVSDSAIIGNCYQVQVYTKGLGGFIITTDINGNEIANTVPISLSPQTFYFCSFSAPYYSVSGPPYSPYVPPSPYYLNISTSGDCSSTNCGGSTIGGCSDSQTITISCGVDLSATTVGNPCGQNGQGSITIFNIGGSPNFQYSINGGLTYQSSNYFTGLNSGTYDITILDASGCTASTQAVIGYQTNLSVSASTTPENCDYSSGGTITINIVGGTPTYSISLNGGLPTTQTYYTGLTVGTYTFNITDSEGCTATIDVTIEPPISLSGTITTSESCSYSPSLNQYLALKVESLINYLGNDVLENEHINYAVCQGYTIFQSYGVAKIWRTLSPTVTNPQGLNRAQAEARLSVFLGKIYSAGLLPVALLGDTADMDWLASVDAVNANKFWGIGLENEFWNGAVSFANWVSYLNYLKVTYPQYFRMAYLANPAGTWGATEALQIIDAQIDVIEITNYNSGKPNPNWGSFVNQLNLLSTAANIRGVNQKFIPLWSAEYNGNSGNNFSGQYFGVTTNYTKINPSAVLTQYDIDFAAVTYAYPPNLTKVGFSMYEYIYAIDAGVLPQCTNLSGSITASTITSGGTGVYSTSGTLTINANGGYAPYQYSVDGGAFGTSNYFTGLNGGIHNFVVIDASGCTVSGTTTIGGAFEFETSVTSLDCLTTSSATICVTSISGGYPPYTYSINGGSFSSSNCFSGLSSGSYTIAAQDLSGCSATTVVFISAPSPIIVNANVIDSISCLDGSSASGGTITITATNGTSPYYYSIDSGLNYQTLNTFINVPVGTYTIVVKDSLNCTGTTTVNVGTRPSFSISASSTPDNCSLTGLGSLTINVIGGYSPYYYSIDGGLFFNGPINSNSYYQGGLNPGVYDIVVEDSSGCTATTQVTIITSEDLTIGVVTTPETCNYNSGGTATISVTGGTPTFTYSLNGSSPVSSNYFTGLTVGTYTVTVTDSLGCNDTITFTIDPPINISGNTTPQPCNGISGGTLTINASSGNPPYTYSVDGGSFTNNNYFTGLTTGSHTIIVKDASGCTASTITQVNPPIIVSAVTTPENCLYTSAGTITIVSTIGGTSPYTYSVNGGSFTNLTYYTGLTFGSYNIIVKDISGCSATTQVTINPPIPVSGTVVTTNLDCNNTNIGTLLITAYGGTSPYTYSVNGGSYTSQNYYFGLSAGTYNITIKDVYGCSATTSGIVSTATPITVSAVSVTAITCTGVSVADLTLIPNGGTPPYTFLWKPINVNTQTVNTGNYITSPGTYTYSGSVVDRYGCSASTTVTFTILSAFTPTLDIIATGDLSCDGSSYVTISAITSGYNTICWSTGQCGVSSITANTPGSYSYYITLSGCVYSSDTVILDYVDVPPPIVGYDANLCICSSTDVSLINNGFTYTDILWNNGETASSFSVSSCTPTGYTFYLTAKDQYGCPVTSNTVTIVFSELDVDVYTNNSVCLECGICIDGYAEVVVNKGTPPYVFSWTGVNSTTNVVDNLQPGNYCVSVTDAAGCFESICFTISATTPTDCTYEPVKDPNGNIILNPDGTISFTDPAINVGPVARISITNYSPTEECCLSNSTTALPLLYCDCKCYWSKPSCSSGDTIIDKIILGTNGNNGIQLINSTPKNNQTIKCQYQVTFNYLFNFDCQSLNDCVQTNYSGDVLTFLSGLSAFATVEVLTTGGTYTTQQIAPIWNFDFYNQPTGVYFGGQNCDLITQSIFNSLGTNCTALTENTFAAIWKTASFKIYDSLVGETIKLGMILEGFGCEYNILLDNIQINEVCVVTEEQIITPPNGGCPGFELEKIVDNKKSWIYNETTYNRDWFHLKYRDTSYIDYDERLDINTKEVDLEVNVSRAINYDIYCYATSPQNCLTISGCNNPNLVVGLMTSIDYCSLGIPYLNDMSGFTGPGRIYFFDALGTLTTDVNQIVNAPAGGLYWDGTDINGVDRTSYFAPITGNTGVLYICQSGVTAAFKFEPNTLQLYYFNSCCLPQIPNSVRPTFMCWPTNTGLSYLQTITPASTLFSAGLVYLYYVLGTGVPPSIQPSNPWVQFPNVTTYTGSVLTFATSGLTAGQTYDFQFSIRVNGTNNPPQPIVYIAFGVGQGGTQVTLLDNITGATNNGTITYNFTQTITGPLTQYNEFFIRIINGTSTKTYFVNYNDLIITEHCEPTNVNSGNIFSIPSGTTFNQFMDLISTQLIDVKDRQSISAYPLLRYFYDKYLGLCGLDNCNTSSGQYNYNTLNNFAQLIGDYWIDLVEQFVPATTIWGGDGGGRGTRTYSNNMFDQPKFEYRNFSFGYCSDYCFQIGATSPLNTSTCYVASSLIKTVDTPLTPPNFGEWVNQNILGGQSTIAGRISSGVRLCASQNSQYNGLCDCINAPNPCLISANINLSMTEGPLTVNIALPIVTNLNTAPNQTDFLNAIYAGLTQLGYSTTINPPYNNLLWSKDSAIGCNDDITPNLTVDIVYSCITGSTLVPGSGNAFVYDSLNYNFPSTSTFNIGQVAFSGDVIYGVVKGDPASNNNFGYLYSYNKNTSTLSILKLFGIIGNSLRHPNGGLVLGNDGWLYGTSLYNNAPGTLYYDWGAIFRYNPITAQFQILTNFNPSIGNGKVTNSSRILYHSNGKLYIPLVDYTNITSYIYELDITQPTPIGNAFLTLGYQTGEVFLSEDTANLLGSNYIFGTTSLGGTFNKGTIFRFVPNIFTPLFNIVYHFGSSTTILSENPSGPLLQSPTIGSYNIFYGLTNGSTAVKQTLYEFDVYQSPTPSAVSVIHTFDGTTPPEGRNPEGNLVISNNKLYGQTTSGGLGYGEIFEYDLIANTNQYNIVHQFINGANGANTPQSYPYLTYNPNDNYIYSVTPYGGFNKNGTLYRFAYTGTPTTYTYQSGIFNCNDLPLLATSLPVLNKLSVSFSADSGTTVSTAISGLSNCITSQQGTGNCPGYVNNPGVEVIVQDLTSLIDNPCVEPPLVAQCNTIFATHIDNDIWFDGWVTVITGATYNNNSITTVFTASTSNTGAI
jgi:hypothetical protein